MNYLAAIEALDLLSDRLIPLGLSNSLMLAGLKTEIVRKGAETYRDMVSDHVAGQVTKMENTR